MERSDGQYLITRYGEFQWMVWLRLETKCFLANAEGEILSYEELESIAYEDPQHEEAIIDAGYKPIERNQKMNYFTTDATKVIKEALREYSDIRDYDANWTAPQVTAALERAGLLIPEEVDPAGEPVKTVMERVRFAGQVKTAVEELRGRLPHGDGSISIQQTARGWADNNYQCSWELPTAGHRVEVSVKASSNGLGDELWMVLYVPVSQGFRRAVRLNAPAEKGNIEPLSLAFQVVLENMELITYPEATDEV